MPLDSQEMEDAIQDILSRMVITEKECALLRRDIAFLKKTEMGVGMAITTVAIQLLVYVLFKV